MNVLIVGAAGKTGSLVVERALAAGYGVTALVHDATGYTPPSPAVRVVAGDAADPAIVDAAMKGANAVIDAVGGSTPFLNTDLERNVAAAVTASMSRHGVRRLVVVSVLGAGESREQAGFFYEYIFIPTFLRGAVKDKEAMEQAVRRSGVDFVLVRPPVLTDAPASGHVRRVGEGETAGKLTRSDLAQFLVDQLRTDTNLNTAVTIENG